MAKLISHLFGRDKVQPVQPIFTDPGAGHPLHCKCRLYHN